MELNDLLWKLEGLHTVETVSEELGLSRQGAINMLSRLKKKGYVSATGGGRQKRIYRVSLRKQLPRERGMFDIINKYSPMKLNPWYDHQVHGKYTVEDVLIDAICTRSFRVILASLRLFGHIKDWKRLYNLAKQKGVWQDVGALYDVSSLFFRTRTMPLRYQGGNFRKRKYIIGNYSSRDFTEISRKWKAMVPFRRGDIEKVVA